MASRRFIDRDFWKCRELNKACARTRLLFIYLFGDEADDFGRIKDDPYLMRRGCFSDDSVTEDEVRAMLGTLVEAGLLLPYLARDESPLLWLPTFQDYQPMGYWAKSRLDRHPDDDFQAFDWIGPRNKRVKTPRELEPVGHFYACAHSPAKSGEVLRNPTESDVSLNPYTYTHTKAVSAQHAAADADVAVDVESNSRKVRREGLRRIGNGVPLNDGTGTANDNNTPEGVAAEDWRLLLGLTAAWPVAGKDGGLAKLEKILRANGPKDAQRRVRHIDNQWKRGALDKPGKPGLPWGVFAGKAKYEPPDEEAVDVAPRKGGQAEELDDILEKTLGTANDTFKKADNPAEASRIWQMVENELRNWNGHDPAAQGKATALARGKMMNHEGQVRVLVAVFDAVTATKDTIEKRFEKFTKILNARRRGSKEARKWAKGITG